jgi:hypothetical protein
VKTGQWQCVKAEKRREETLRGMDAWGRTWLLLTVTEQLKVT